MIEYFRDLIFEIFSGWSGSNSSTKNAFRSRSLNSNPANIISILMKRIKTQLILNPEEYQIGDGQANRQAQNVDA